jgi:hypothetical protein
MDRSTDAPEFHGMLNLGQAGFRMRSEECKLRVARLRTDLTQKKKRLKRQFLKWIAQCTKMKMT